MTKSISILLFVLLFQISTLSFASVDPDLKWKTLRTPHFDLIYDAQQQELADLYARRLESARAKLVPLWPTRPEKITVILNDRTDLTNGYATALPYAHIMIYPVLPGPQETISEFGDWAEEILIHEMTHILSFEQRRDSVQILSRVFGTIITPNLLLPKWWLEGVAVDAETRLSEHGRLRSNYQDAVLRALVSEPTWQMIEYPEINEAGLPSFPMGGRPYLYGSLLWSEMIALKGERMIGELHHAFGGRVPYFLASPVEELFDGMDLEVLWMKTRTETANRVQAQREQLSKVPFTPLEPFGDADLRETFNPKISPDGLKMAMLAKDDTLKRSIQVLVRDSTDISFSAAQRLRNFGQKEEISTPAGLDIKLPRSQVQPFQMQDDAPPGGTINRVSWMRDSKSFIFDLVSERDQFQDTSDLWRFSLQKGKAEQITKGLRAREPEVSPDGTYVAYVQIDAGRTSLAVRNLSTKETRVLYKPELMTRVAWPVWLSANQILITVREKSGEKFWIVNVADSKVTQPNLNFHEVSLPFVKSGQLYFVSNDSGVRNLYVTDVAFSTLPKAITHLWTGAYASDLDVQRNELWLTRLSASGFELVKKTSGDAPVAEALPRLQPLFADRYPGSENVSDAAKSAAASEADTSAFTSEDYSPGSYLWPRYWLPFFSWDDKGTKISVNTGGFDPLSKHTYSLFASYETATKQGDFLGRYQNQSFRPTLVLQASSLSSYLADPTQRNRSQSFLAESIWQLAGISPNLSLIAGWSWLKREQNGLTLDPNERFSEQTGPTLGINYARVQKTGEQISPESGGSATLTTTQYVGGGSRESFNQTTLNLLKYGKIPWGHHHAWMARVAGQYIDSRISLSNYDSTVSTLSASAPFTQIYLMRGYPTGSFLGKSIANANLEYRFPIRRIDKGFSRFPFFAQQLTGAFVTDAIWFDGFGYDTTSKPYGYRQLTTGKGFGSAGAEVKTEFTLGYHFELAITLGLYMPFSDEISSRTPRLGMGLSL